MTRPRTGDVDVIVNYTNCVQCGAITAKGGRLTTPEGGDGPLYQITLRRPCLADALRRPRALVRQSPKRSLRPCFACPSCR